MKIYVASSWRNIYQPEVVDVLRRAGYEVYDFRNPAPEYHGFHWSQVDHYWGNWDPQEYIDALKDPIAELGFRSDFGAMKDADACVLVLPCNRSGHLEAGYFAGAGKKLFVLIPERMEPELMYKMADGIFDNIHAVLNALGEFDHERKSPRSP